LECDRSGAGHRAQRLHDLADTAGTVFATTAENTVAFPPSFTSYAATQVVDLTSPTSLTVQCTTDPPLFGLTYTYEDLSIYAISFAP